MLPQQYCLRWRYHHSNLQTMFSQLLEREAFCDVTLACEGRTIKAHKIVLSACSTYFETILSQYEEKDPILIMKDVKYVDIKCLVEFMYKGEINVDHCHLATLLKTAEDLKIKGLAEVSWRDEEQQSPQQQPHNQTTTTNDNGGEQINTNGIQATLPAAANSVMDNITPKTDNLTNKRKRGRPPIDDYDQAFTTPKIMNVTGNADDAYSNDAMSTSDHDLCIWEEEPPANEANEGAQPADEMLPTIKKEILSQDDEMMMGDPGESYFPMDMKLEMLARAGSAKSMANVTTSGGQSFLTPALEKEWPDVVKMNDYLNTGRRQQFWEEPFTKRVMDAIKTKNLEMKVAAELLGVSYGTLYGRYRDSYGCLKHPYRVRDFWTEQGPTDVLLKLKKKEITLYRAAEQLNVTPQTLSNYLISMSQLDTSCDSSFGNLLNAKMEHYEEIDSDEDDEDAHSIFPDITTTLNNTTRLFSNMRDVTCINNTTLQSSTNSVLANCPDITIIKKEKHDGNKVNNNFEHSDSNNDQK